MIGIEKVKKLKIVTFWAGTPAYPTTLKLK